MHSFVFHFIIYWLVSVNASKPRLVLMRSRSNVVMQKVISDVPPTRCLTQDLLLCGLVGHTHTRSDQELHLNLSFCSFTTRSWDIFQDQLPHLFLLCWGDHLLHQRMLRLQKLRQGAPTLYWSVCVMVVLKHLKPECLSSLNHDEDIYLSFLPLSTVHYSGVEVLIIRLKWDLS